MEAKASIANAIGIFREIYGRGDPKVIEHPDAIKAYLVRQESVKIDLTKLAKLRFRFSVSRNDKKRPIRKDRSL